MAQRFAAALDADDFAAAQSLLAPDCVYDTREERLIGAEAVVDSYRQASRWGRVRFDRIEYQHELLESGPDMVRILFRDRVTRRDLSHTYACRQVLTFGAEDRIVRIEHQEIPGERERLLDYLRRCGLEPE